MSDHHLRIRAARELAQLCAAIRAAHPYIAWQPVTTPAPPRTDKPLAGSADDPRLSIAIGLYRAGATNAEIAERIGLRPGSLQAFITTSRARGAWPAELVRPEGRPKART